MWLPARRAAAAPLIWIDESGRAATNGSADVPILTVSSRPTPAA